MDGFEENIEQDLFNLLLKNPEYKISTNENSKSFIDKLSASHHLQCIACTGRICKILMYYKDETLCVGCFCKSYDSDQTFLTVDLSKRQSNESKQTLFEQLQLVNSMSELGIENYEGISKLVHFQTNECSVQEYQETFLKYKTIVENKDDECLIKKQPWKKMKEQFVNSLLMSQYKVSDYMLANIHDKSSPEEQQFLLAYKKNEENQMQKIHKSIEQIAQDYSKNSVHPQQFDQFDDELSVSELQLDNNMMEDEFKERSNNLVKEADDFIERKKKIIKDRKTSYQILQIDSNESIKKNHLIKKQIKKQKTSPKTLKNKLNLIKANA